MFKNIGVPEILLIALVLIILLGKNKLTDLAKGAGEATRELKKAKTEVEEAIKETKLKESDKREGGVSK